MGRWESITEILQAALALSEPERLELVERIEASLTQTSHSLQPGWLAELQRRAADIDAGAVRPVPGDDVRQLVQDCLSNHESSPRSLEQGMDFLPGR